MNATGDRLEFAPPPQPGLLRALALAVGAHLLLVIALAFGLNWQRETENTVAEAELWSQLPQQAAPREVPVPPAPPAPPVVRAPPQPDPQVQRDAQIALERERARQEAEERRQAELRQEQERKRKLEAQRKREEELARRKEEEERRLAEEKRQQQLAEARRKAELEKERKRRLQEEQQAKQLAQLREDNLRRIQGLAGASGGAAATGNAQKSSGPSASWGARVRGRVKPNITFTGTVNGNPEAVVNVRLAPDGTIIGKRLVKSSGSKAWDDAVLRALEKTEVLPRDVDGTVPSGGDLVFRPND